jgi:hypothetical protein
MKWGKNLKAPVYLYTHVRCRSRSFPYLVDGIGTTPQIEIVDKIGIYYIGGGVVANNMATNFEIIGALAMTTFPSSVHTYDGQILLRHVWLGSFY